MTSGSVQVTIDGIRSKIDKLALLHKNAQDENFKLKAEREQLLKILEDKKNIIINLEDKNKRIKLAKSLTDAGGSTLDVKLKINEMVREIDKCVAFLNK